MANAFASRAKEWEFESLIPHHFLILFNYQLSAVTAVQSSLGFLLNKFKTAVTPHSITTIHIGVA